MVANSTMEVKGDLSITFTIPFSGEGAKELADKFAEYMMKKHNIEIGKDA